MRKKIFISSVIAKYADCREAVAAAARAVDCEVIRAENFSARPETPQQACLNELRKSDIVVFILGATYGVRQNSGLSATHEEWKVAINEQKPILVFVEELSYRDREQTEFIREVEQWEGGRFRRSFNSPSGLQEMVTQALHNWIIKEVSIPISKEDMLIRANQVLPNHQTGFIGSPQLYISVAGGPHLQIIRPGKLKDNQFHEDLQQNATFGSNSLLDPQASTRHRISQGCIAIEQNHASITLHKDGTVLIIQPAILKKDRQISLIPSIIEEDLHETISRALRLASEVLDMVDNTNRITDLVTLAVLFDVSVVPWKTRAEQVECPNIGSIEMDRSGVVVGEDLPSIRRSNLYNTAAEIAEDLCVLLQQANNTRRYL